MQGTPIPPVVVHGPYKIWQTVGEHFHAESPTSSIYFIASGHHGQTQFKIKSITNKATGRHYCAARYHWAVLPEVRAIASILTIMGKLWDYDLSAPHVERKAA